MFLCNCLPHLTAGLRGEPFPTPFAKPRGIGHSSATTNFLWGTLNLVVGIALLKWVPVVIGINPGAILLLAGFLALGWPMSRHFEAVRMNRKNGPGGVFSGPGGVPLALVITAVGSLFFSGCATNGGNPTAAPTSSVQTGSGTTISGYMDVGAGKSIR